MLLNSKFASFKTIASFKNLKTNIDSNKPECILSVCLKCLNERLLLQNPLPIEKQIVVNELNFVTFVLV